MQQPSQSGSRVVTIQPQWEVDTTTRTEAGKLKPAVIDRMVFSLLGVYADGLPYPKADLPRLVFRDGVSIQFVLNILRQAKQHSVGSLLRNKVDSVLFFLRNGQNVMFNFNIEAPEYTFGEEFYKRVPPFLSEKCAEQVRAAVARARPSIVAIKSPSGQRWSRSAEVAAIIKELEQVNARFYNFYRERSKLYEGRVVTVETTRKPLRLFFVSPAPSLVRRLAWLR